MALVNIKEPILLHDNVRPHNRFSNSWMNRAKKHCLIRHIHKIFHLATLLVSNIWGTENGEWKVRAKPPWEAILMSVVKVSLKYSLLEIFHREERLCWNLGITRLRNNGQRIMVEAACHRERISSCNQHEFYKVKLKKCTALGNCTDMSMVQYPVSATQHEHL